MADPQKLGDKGMRNVASVLRAHGHEVLFAGYYSPFDLMLNGHMRAEIKTASLNGLGKWKFNIHRHGKLNEDTDIYILRLEKVPFSKKATHLLFWAPIGVSTLEIQPFNLMTKYWKQAADFQAFCKAGKKHREQRKDVKP